MCQAQNTKPLYDTETNTIATATTPTLSPFNSNSIQFIVSNFDYKINTPPDIIQTTSTGSIIWYHNTMSKLKSEFIVKHNNNKQWSSQVIATNQPFANTDVILLSADINQDGWKDIVLAYEKTVVWYLNIPGKNTFETTPNTIAISETKINHIAAALFTNIYGTRTMNIVVASSGKITLFKNINGKGTSFSTGTVVSTALSNPHSLVVCDLNENGWLDIAAVGELDGNIVVGWFQNKGRGDGCLMPLMW